MSDANERAIQNVENRIPVYTQEQVDQLILTPEARATVIIRKRPLMVKIPVYKKDLEGNKIQIVDKANKPIVDKEGNPKFVVEKYRVEQRGEQAVAEQLPASEVFTIDNSTSNIGDAASRLELLLMFNYNKLLFKQSRTKKDYSDIIHKQRNDIIAILASGKSYNGGTIQSIKTFRTISDNKQFTNDSGEQKQMFNPISAIFGGNKKKNAPEKEKDYTAFK